MFVENHSLLSGTDEIPYSMNQNEMGGDYSMVIVPYLKMSIISFLLQNDIPHVLLVNLFKQTHPSDSFV